MSAGLHNPLQLHAPGHAPTLIEMLAIERLMPQLREALQYTLAVVAARHPRLLRAHAYSDELWALCLLVLEAHCLRTADASFAESFYGIRRARRDRHGRTSRLTAHQRALSLLALVALPYARAKAAALHREAMGARRGAVLARAAARAPPTLPPTPAAARGARASAPQPQARATAVAATPAAAPLGARARVDAARTAAAAALARAARHVSRVVRMCVVGAYPLFDTAAEAERFGWQLAHAFGATPHWSTLLFCARVAYVRRAPDDEISAEATAAAGAMAAALREVRGLARAGAAQHAPALARALGRVLRLSGAIALDHARHGLIILIVAIKILHWWYSPEAVAAKPPAPPLPPPPPLPPAPGARALPAEKHVCPLCRMPRVNATLAPSGYVFCYRCIFDALERDGRCPVTRMPAEVEALRKLYEPAGDA